MTARNRPFSRQQADPQGIAVDATSVYWITNGPDVYYPGDSHAQGSVASAPLLGGTVATLAARQAQPKALFLQSSTLYWVDDYAGSLLSMPAEGGSPKTVIEDGLNIHAIAIAGDAIYFTEFGSVKTVPTSGGTPTTVAAGSFVINDFGGIAVDDAFVYWGNQSALLRAPK